jgi:hypothetical protein
VNGLFYTRAVMVLPCTACLCANAADKIATRINHQLESARRTPALESAKEEAIGEHKPIAWIATSPKRLDDQGTIYDGMKCAKALEKAPHEIRGKYGRPG